MYGFGKTFVDRKREILLTSVIRMRYVCLRHGLQKKSFLRRRFSDNLYANTRLPRTRSRGKVHVTAVYADTANDRRNFAVLHKPRWLCFARICSIFRGVETQYRPFRTVYTWVYVNVRRLYYAYTIQVPT